MPLVAAHELDIDSGSIQIYNALDSLVTYEVLGELKALLPGYNAPQHLFGPQLIYDFERALQAPAMEMMLRGWKVDPWARETGIAELRRRLERLSLIIDCYAGAIWDQRSPTKSKKDYPKPKLLNPESEQQLRTFFYDYMNLKPIVRYKNGEEKRPMDRDILEHLDKYFIARPIVQAILAYRDTAGQLEVMESQVDDDWRLHTSYNPAATTTGRWSSSKSVTGTGRNVQNIEEDLRYWLVADDGKKLLGADLEQAESRETAWLCGVLFDDWNLLDSCESGDPHVTTARTVWPNLAWNGDATRDRKIADGNYYRHFSYRDMAKRCRHATEKGGLPPEISKQLRIPVPQIREFQERFFSAYPAMPKLFTWIASQLQRDRYLINAFGRRRDFFGRADSNDTVKEAIAFMTQSPTADRLNLGLWRIWRYESEIELLAQIHDAIYAQRKEDTDEAALAARIKHHLDVPLSFRGRCFTVPSELKVGWRWCSANDRWPDGMIKFKGADIRTRTQSFAA